MRYAFALAFLLSLAVACAAQPAEPDKSPSITADGAFGIGQLFINRLSSGRISSLWGFDMAANVGYRQHAVGVRARVFTPLSLVSFGPSPQMWEMGGVYSFTAFGGFSVGAGISYVSESYRSEATSELTQSNRIGVPLEISFRSLNTAGFGPYVRTFANANADRFFGGVSVGVSL